MKSNHPNMPVRIVSWLVLILGIAVVSKPVQGEVTAPASSHGKFTVTWTESSGGHVRAFLKESKNGLAWKEYVVTGRNEKTFCNPDGHYRYKLERCIWEPEIEKCLPLSVSNQVTVVVSRDPPYQWEAHYGREPNYREYGKQALPTQDGNFLIMGDSEYWVNETDTDILLVKANNCGQKLWQKVFDLGVWTRGRSLLATRDGGYLIVGEVKNTSSWVNSQRLLVIKMDASGNEEDHKLLQVGEFDVGASAIQTRDRGYVVVGHTISSNNTNLLVVRLDQNLNIVDEPQTFGGSHWDIARHIAATRDGGYVVVGSTRSRGDSDSDVFLLKFEADGDFEWQQFYNDGQDEHGHCVRQTDDGGYIIAGRKVSAAGNDNEMFLVRTDALGYELWTEKPGLGAAHYVQKTWEGSYVIAGYSVEDGNQQAYLAKIIAGEEQMDTLWEETFGGDDADWAMSVEQDESLGYVLCGTTLSFDWDLYLIYFQPDEWDSAYNVMFDAPYRVALFRQYRDQFLSRSAKGKQLTEQIYRNSDELLMVLLKNPELMLQGKSLIEANQQSVVDVLNGKRGVIEDTAGLLSFIDEYVKKAPKSSAELVNAIGKQIEQSRTEKNLFFGFELR